MNENHPHQPSDADLMRAYQAGDAPAAGLLDDRHGAEALRLADHLVGPDAADGLVDDAFEHELRAIRAGHGPEVAFRPGLLSTLVSLGPAPADADGPLRQAFASLPERWRAVLWHLSVHAESPQEVAAQLGMAPSVVTSLEIQGREGLRRAYLATHLDRPGSSECEDVREMLPAFGRDMLTESEVDTVEDHLDDCAECREAAIVLGDETLDLGLVLAPAVLGEAGLEAFGAVGARSTRARSVAPAPPRPAAAVHPAPPADVVDVDVDETDTEVTVEVESEPAPVPVELPGAEPTTDVPVAAARLADDRRVAPSRAPAARRTSALTAADVVAQAAAEAAAKSQASRPARTSRSGAPQHAGAARPAAAARPTATYRRAEEVVATAPDLGLDVFGVARDTPSATTDAPAPERPAPLGERLGAFWSRRGRLSAVATLALVAVGGVSMVGLWEERSSANDRDLGALTATLDLLPSPAASSAASPASPSASPSAESVVEAPSSAPATTPPVAGSPTAVATKPPAPEPTRAPADEPDEKPTTAPSASVGQDLSIALTSDYSVRGFGRVSFSVNAPGVAPTVSISAPRGASAYAYGGGMQCSGQGGDRLTCTGAPGSSGLTVIWRGGDDATLRATVSAGGNKDPRPGNNAVSTG